MSSNRNGPPVDQYLEPSQTTDRPPTDFENALGDAIEGAYGAGTHDLAGLVAHLNQHGPPSPDGATWTEDIFTSLMAELGR